MSITEWYVFGILFALTIWGLLKVAKGSTYKEHEDIDARQEDDAAMDTIRDELERQSAPFRPHIRSVK